MKRTHVEVRVASSIAGRAKDEFMQFRKAYVQYRNYCNLTGINKPFEVLAGMADKLGRVAREVKHLERKDPRCDAHIEMRDGIAGVIIYALLLAELYSIDIAVGLESEMIKARIQHSKGKKG